MRFGCCVSLDQMETAQDAGYDYLELSASAVKAESPYAEFEPVRERIQEIEIAPEVWHDFLAPDMKVVGPEVDKYRIERYMRTAFERIEELGGEILIFGGGPARDVPEGFDFGEARRQLAEFLALAGQIAGIRGITIALAPLNSKQSNMINTLTEAVELVRQVDHPFVKVSVDLYQMQEAGEPMRGIIDAGDEIVHAHIADIRRLYPGSGEYSHAEFFEALKTIGYDDRLSVECGWGNFQTECARALDFLRELYGQNSPASGAGA